MPSNYFGRTIQQPPRRFVYGTTEYFAEDGEEGKAHNEEGDSPSHQGTPVVNLDETQKWVSSQSQHDTQSMKEMMIAGEETSSESGNKVVVTTTPTPSPPQTDEKVSAYTSPNGEDDEGIMKQDEQNEKETEKEEEAVDPPSTDDAPRPPTTETEETTIKNGSFVVRGSSLGQPVTNQSLLSNLQIIRSMENSHNVSSDGYDPTPTGYPSISPQGTGEEVSEQQQQQTTPFTEEEKGQQQQHTEEGDNDFSSPPAYSLHSSRYGCMTTEVNKEDTVSHSSIKPNENNDENGCTSNNQSVLGAASASAGTSTSSPRKKMTHTDWTPNRSPPRLSGVTAAQPSNGLGHQIVPNHDSSRNAGVSVDRGGNDGEEGGVSTPRRTPRRPLPTGRKCDGVRNENEYFNSNSDHGHGAGNLHSTPQHGSWSQPQQHVDCFGGSSTPRNDYVASTAHHHRHTGYDFADEAAEGLGLTGIGVERTNHHHYYINMPSESSTPTSSIRNRHLFHQNHHQHPYSHGADGGFGESGGGTGVNPFSPYREAETPMAAKKNETPTPPQPPAENIVSAMSALQEEIAKLRTELSESRRMNETLTVERDFLRSQSVLSSTHHSRPTSQTPVSSVQTSGREAASINQLNGNKNGKASSSPHKPSPSSASSKIQSRSHSHSQTHKAKQNKDEANLGNTAAEAEAEEESIVQCSSCPSESNANQSLDADETETIKAAASFWKRKLRLAEEVREKERNKEAAAWGYERRQLLNKLSQATQIIQRLVASAEKRGDHEDKKRRK